MRADKYFAEQFGSRTKAAEAIEKGWVLINGKQIKPKTEILETDEISIVSTEERFVSNGGYKLSKGLKEFSFDCTNKVCVDIGASTGGFTDCVLQNGAKKVYAVDVGESLLHSSLLADNRIIRMENTNARYLTDESFHEEIDVVVTDVSFISLRLIFPAIKQILSSQGDAFVLIKPQFETENKHIGKSGIVHNTAHPKIVERVLGYAEENGLYTFGIVHAPLRKGKNVEYVVHLKPTYSNAIPLKKAVDIVENLLKNEIKNTL